MSYLSIFLASFTVALSGALAPGPVLTAVICESARRGFKAGPLIMLGHAALEAAMVALLVLGIGRFINTPAVLKIISLLGAAILLFFAVMIVRSLPSLTIGLPPSRKHSSNLALLGVTLSLANPYWTVWWVSIGLGFVLMAQKQGPAAVLVFFSGHILADTAWYSFVAFIISKGRRFISPGIYRGIMAACAAVLAGFAFWFALFSF